ncbi:MAG: hypothetical protein HXL32_07190 [Prevotellaceae bacterium]|nr:hypothetical protein [Prevotellaceae bacterium]
MVALFYTGFCSLFDGRRTRVPRPSATLLTAAEQDVWRPPDNDLYIVFKVEG